MKKSLLYLLSLGMLNAGCFIEPNKNYMAEKRIKDESLNQNRLEYLLKSVYKLKIKSKIKETLYDRKGNVLGFTEAFTIKYGSCFAFARKDKDLYFGTAEHCLADEPEDKEGTHLNNIIKFKKELSDVKISLIEYSNNVEKEVKTLEEIARNEKSDVALLLGRDFNFNDQKISWYPYLANPRSIYQGQDIWSIGFPHSLAFTSGKNWGKQITRGIVTSIDTNPEISGGEKIIFTEAALDGGMSGGPAFININGYPRIIGVNTRVYSNLKFKFGISLGLIDLLRERKLDYLIKSN